MMPGCRPGGSMIGDFGLSGVIPCQVPEGPGRALPAARLLSLSLIRDTGRPPGGRGAGAAIGWRTGTRSVVSADFRTGGSGQRSGDFVADGASVPPGDG